MDRINQMSFKKCILSFCRVISEDDILRSIMAQKESKVKFSNLCAKFIINDLSGIIKKHGKTIKDMPDLKRHLIAYYFERITRNQLREYAERALNG